ncbi:hypothetical protein [Streptomyces radicis]|uniref:Uncharacterized protein n=1 Tax=Streptomyces radicis TaxID=1750517 RepID=A0A3A9WDB3_9ACTN|nr:hypothetical protein [Streptomyces radicis]RKN10975.1 hypothetical protein D7319_07530 [Streptomyces radicis]RKN25238.1 hypothetical protein D7318_08385 [Streptomyces radicis]
MSGEGLEYLPDGLRQGGRGSYASADAAESARSLLRGVEADPAGFGGADAFAGAVNGARDRQSRGVERAGEDREDMADGDHQAAAIGEDTDVAATAAVQRSALGDTGRGIADAI